MRHVANNDIPPPSLRSMACLLGATLSSANLLPLTGSVNPALDYLGSTPYVTGADYLKTQEGVVLSEGASVGERHVMLVNGAILCCESCCAGLGWEARGRAGAVRKLPF
jgi:hypothetical protein